VIDIYCRAKFTNDSNFFVCKVGRGSGVLERSLEIAEVLRVRGRRWWRQPFMACNPSYYPPLCPSRMVISLSQCVSERRIFIHKVVWLYKLHQNVRQRV